MLKAYIFMQVYTLRPANLTLCLRQAIPGLYHSWGVNTPLPYLHTTQTPVLNVCHSALHPCNKTACFLFISIAKKSQTQES